MPRPSPRRTLLAIVGLLYAAVSLPSAAVDLVALDGHVLPILGNADGLAAVAKSSSAADEPVTLTVVLRRERQHAFEALLADLEDPSSPSFRRYASPAEVSDRYGPSQDSYQRILRYFESQGFALSEGSANRLTLTFRGTRAMAEAALGVSIVDYRIGDRSFRANANEPMLPADLAPLVQSIIGLSDLARPRSNVVALQKAFCAVIYGLFATTNGGAQVAAQLMSQYFSWCNDLKWPWEPGGGGTKARVPRESSPARAPEATVVADRFDAAAGTPALTAGAVEKAGNDDWLSLTGAGQTIGILSFDSFHASDVSDFFTLAGRASLAAQVSRVAVNGGVAPGVDQSEVLLDIVSALAVAPGAQVVVYDAPFTGGGTSFQTLLNAMINGGVTIISNSWAYCEDQTTPADAQSIDALFAAAAASGISAFNATGDRGSTCLDGSANVVHVPASSPHATAVGGSSVELGLGKQIASETWWDGTSDAQPTGQGGYGSSAFFTRPSYQNGWVAAAQRSVPDLVANADPKHGRTICQASDGGCPNGKLYGGTSMAAPTWAGFAAILNEGTGTNLGAFNAAVYPHGATAFRGAAALGSDFAHVGLGGVRLNTLLLALKGASLGAPDAARSTVEHRSTVEDGFEHPPHPEVPADGTARAVIVVQVRDANGNPIGGKTVSLAASAGSSAIVTPASVANTATQTAAVFTVTDLVTEVVTFTATDATDALALTPTVDVTFGVPPAAAASIAASPASVLNDGIATTTITVTLQDALGRPTPGKQIALSQGGGHSVISGPNPSVTDAAGKIEFTATDTHAETVTYTAVDVTDGDLAVPGGAVVQFTGQPTSTCVTTVPTAAAGFAITPWSSGYAASAFTYSGISFGCAGASNPVFDADGSAVVASFPDGKLFRLPAGGGVATSGNLLATHGPTLSQPVFGKDGRLYAARGATGGGLFSGAIVEIDPDDGSILRTVVSPATCPQGLAIDPLSGDLFYDDTCFGGGTDDARVFRVSDPATTATVSTYATLPGSPSGWLAFAPDGTLFVQSNYLDPTPNVQRISGTDQPQPATVTEIANLTSTFWLTIGETLPSGAAKSLIVLGPAGLRLADITTDPPTFSELTNGGSSSGVVGPDGCLYFSALETIFRLSKDSGECGFDAASAVPSLVLTPGVVTPDPAQGTSIAFSARFANVAVPAGTPVQAGVEGANAQIRLATTDAEGVATFDLVGVFAGDDKVVVTASVGGVDYRSSTTRVRWTAGRHATFLTVALSPGGGTVGSMTTLRATLFDASVDPPTPIAGQAIHFTLGVLACDGVTGADGVASCVVVPATAGAIALSARYDGNASYLGSTAGDMFFALAAPDPACYRGLLASGGTATACVSGPLAGCRFDRAAFVPVASAGAPPPAGVAFPFGLFEFSATGCGGALTLDIDYPSPVPPGTAYWKFGPTSVNATPHWYTLPATVSGNRISVAFVDGGAGDSDLAANGTIVDPGGAGIGAAPTSAQPVPATRPLVLAALAAMLAIVALGRGRAARAGGSPSGTTVSRRPTSG